jgi:transcriptional regulator with XRE-family HTH domain
MLTRPEPAAAAAKRRSVNPIDRHIGQRVRARRLQIAMSQEKLGDKLGITFQQVQKYEKGVNRIGSGRLADIARILGVPVAWFYAGAPGLPDADAAEPALDLYAQIFATREGVRLARAFLAIADPRMRAAIVQVAEAAAGAAADGAASHV